MSGPRVGVVLDRAGMDAGALLAEAAALDAAGAESLWVAGAGVESWMLLGAVAAVTRSVRLGTLGAGDSECLAALDWLSRGRAASGGPGEGWVRLEVPASRAEWKERLGALGESVTGVLVGWDPKLVDLLRNPDQEEDRQDTLLAQG